MSAARWLRPKPQERKCSAQVMHFQEICAALKIIGVFMKKNGLYLAILALSFMYSINANAGTFCIGDTFGLGYGSVYRLTCDKNISILKGLTRFQKDKPSNFIWSKEQAFGLLKAKQQNLVNTFSISLHVPTEAILGLLKGTAISTVDIFVSPDLSSSINSSNLNLCIVDKLHLKNAPLTRDTLLTCTGQELFAEIAKTTPENLEASLIEKGFQSISTIHDLHANSDRVIYVKAK